MNKKDNRSGQAPSSARPKHPLKAGAGKMLGKPAGDATEKSTILLNQTFEQSPIPMVLVSMPGAVLQIVNSAYRTLVGIADEPSRIGTSLVDAKFSFQYYSADGKPVTVDQLPLRKALSSKKAVHEEYRIVRKDGTERRVMLNAAPIFNDQGDISGGCLVMSDITDQNQAEENLRESEERFRAIFNATFQFTGLLTPEGILIETNRAALDFAGITLEEIKNRPFWDARWWHGIDGRVEQLKDAIGRAAKGEFVRYEVELQGAGSTTMLIDFSLKPVFDAKGKVTLLVPEGRDISDRRRVKENLQKERDRLYAITETSPVGITFVDRRGQILFANRQAENILGLSRDVITRQTYNAPVWRITDENGHTFPEAELPFRRVMDTGKPVQDLRHAIAWPDGRRVLLSISAAPLLNAEGCIDGMVAAVEDITERKRIENALRESEEQYRALIESSPDIIMRFDEEGRHLFVSDNVKDAAGIPAALFIGKTHRELDFPEPQCSFFEESIRRVFQSGAPFETEFTFDGPSGAMVFNWRLIPELDTQENVRSVLSIGRDITDHRHAEQEYKTLFTEMLDGFALHEIICDDQGRPADYRFLAVNPSFERMTGLKAVNIVGHTVRDIMPGTEQYWIDRYGKVALTGEPAYFENYAGEIGKYFEVTAYRPAPNRFACIFTDITGRKLAEAAIRESEEKFSTAFENAPILMIITSIEDGTIMDINAAVTKLTGFTREEAIGRKTHELGWIKPEERTHLVQELEETGSTEDREIEAQDRNGKKIQCLVFRKVITISGHKRLLTLAQDITERKQAQDAVRESEAVFRMIFTQSPVGAAIVSLDKKFINTNLAFCKYLGYSEKELIGKTIADVTYPDDLEKGMPELKMMMEGKSESANMEKRYLRKDGKVVWGDLTISLVRSANNTPLYFIPIIQDITGRKLAEEEKEKLQAQLFQSQKMESIGRLAGGVAHDFNNMLGVILGRTQMALDRIDPSHPLHDDLAEIQKAAERSADITRQLLAFARRQTVTPVLLDVNRTVTDMKKMLQRLIGENINLICIPGRDLWPVRMDPGQIDQILANLCVNARDAIEGVGKVTLETQNVVIDEASCADQGDCSPGDYVLLTVSDDGCGISPELHAHLFEPFFTTKEIGKGTGLGLATVYGIVKQNRGFITVESAPGQGTTFNIYLPRHITGKDPAQATAPGRPEAQGHETILLVEDEPAILKLTTIMLERLGYTVLPAGRPGEAIHLAREHAGTIHLLMTDVVMPEMNGRDLAKNLLSVYPDIKRLFMSGYTADIIAHQGVLDEGVHFIQKPFYKNELASKVREALDH